MKRGLAMHQAAHACDLPSDYEKAMADRALARSKKYPAKRRHGGARGLTPKRGQLVASDGTVYVRAEKYARGMLRRIGRLS